MNLIEKSELFFAEFGISLNEARNKLKEMPLAKEAWNLKNSFHCLYFAMISLTLIDVKNVLEMGTGIGGTTAILSELFPASTIYTLDLPEKDNICIKKKGINGISQFKQNTKRENITFIAKNSFFLPSLGLPEEFEIIWVDGGHRFPVVAWDIMFAYNHLREDGFMLMHDYYVTPARTSQVKDTLDCVVSLIKEKVWYLPSDAKSQIAKTVCIRKGYEQ